MLAIINNYENINLCNYFFLNINSVNMLIFLVNSYILYLKECYKIIKKQYKGIC